LTQSRPKSLIDLGGGQTILDRQLQAIAKSGVRDVTIVCGHFADQLEEQAEALGQRVGLNVNTQYNPFYWCSNNLISLWFAKRWIEEGNGVVIVNGDDLFKPRVLISLLSVDHDRELAVVVSRKEKYDTEDMKIVVDADLIKKISKTIPTDKADGESIGMIRVVGKEACQRVAGQLELMARQEKYRDLFWLECFNELIDQGYSVYPHEIADADWVEMDVHPDLSMISRQIQSSVSGIEDD
jgi:choline kinase